MQPESGFKTLLTTHFCHTQFLPLVFNCGVLATFGHQLLAAKGSSHFMRLLGLTAGSSALFAAIDIRNN